MKQSNVKTSVLIVTLITLMCLIVGGCSATKQPEHQAMDIARSEWNVDVYIDSGVVPLGAYAVELQFDPATIQIREVTGGSCEAFANTPKSMNPKTFNTGKTQIADFQTNEKGPAGKVHVCTVHFKAVGHGVSNVRIILNTCSDPLGNKITANATVSLPEITVP